MTSPFHRLHVTQVSSMKEDLSSSGIMRESSPLSSSPSSSSTPSGSFVTSSTSSTEASTPDAEGEASPQRSPAHHPSDDQQGILIHSEQVEHIHHDDHEHEHEHDPENAAAQSESTAISSSISSSSSSASSSSSSSLSNPSDDRCTLRLLIDNSQVGAIIGAKGASIARVRAHSGACVTILKHPHPHPHPRAPTSPTDSPSTTSAPSYIHERILVLKGQRSNLPKAIQLIAQDILNAARERGSVKDAYTNVQQGTTKIVILVNKSVVGCILGKGGESIRITTISTHTRIEISHHALPYSNEKSVTIYGSPYALASAVNIILQQLYEFHTRMGISFTTSHPYVPGTHARVATSTSTAHPQQSHFPQQEYEAKDDHILLNEVDQQLNEATLRRSSASSLGDEYIYTATTTTTTASTPLHPHHHTHHHPHLHHHHQVHFPPTASAAYSSSSMSSSYASTPSYSATSFSSSPFSSSPSTPRSHHEYLGEYSTSAQAAQTHTPMMMMTMMPHTPQSPQTLLLTPSTPPPPSTTMNMLAAAAGGLPPLSAATTLVYQQEVSIPIEVAIHLLSKGGEVLKELRASTGCMISVSDPRVPSAFWAAEERLLNIIGTQQGIWMAICIIKQLINDYQHQQQQHQHQQQQRAHSQQLQQQQQG